MAPCLLLSRSNGQPRWKAVLRRGGRFLLWVECGCLGWSVLWNLDDDFGRMWKEPHGSERHLGVAYLKMSPMSPVLWQLNHSLNLKVRSTQCKLRESNIIIQV